MRYLADFGNKLFDKPSYIYICIWVHIYMIICNYTYYMFELVHDGGTIFQHILELVSREVMSCQGDLHSTCS